MRGKVLAHTEESGGTQKCENFPSREHGRAPPGRIRDESAGGCERLGVRRRGLNVELQQGKALPGVSGFEFGALAVGGTLSSWLGLRAVILGLPSAAPL